ncbi:MAG TPA: methyltransferase domain-containing protein [Solirubrobacteraceae bacterium]|nr:methyltransferase domain-containing protein [Solirubrobacteraceae bacterium]
MTTPRDWDAATYERLSAPIAAMGVDVLDRLELRGSETVLDAGCGTGKVTRVLCERLPRGRVIAVDAAPSMVAQARALLPGSVDVRQADLRSLSLREPVDAILSTATFHWIADHDALFASLYAALRPGGRLVAQCGGEGNVEEIKDAGFAAAAEDPFAEHLAGWPGDWHFPSVAATERRLRAAGFADVWCWRTRLEVDPGDRAGYLRAICLGSFLERLPEDLREPFMAAALARLPDPLTIHYVRLNILARRPGVPPPVI